MSQIFSPTLKECIHSKIHVGEKINGKIELQVDNVRICEFPAIKFQELPTNWGDNHTCICIYINMFIYILCTVYIYIYKCINIYIYMYSKLTSTSGVSTMPQQNVSWESSVHTSYMPAKPTSRLVLFDCMHLKHERHVTCDISLL